MKFYLDHFSSFLKLDKKDKISEKLMQLGHENLIEGNILEVDITPNRGDCLSIRGISRDLSHFYESDLSIEKYEIDIPRFELDFENKSKDECKSIVFLSLEIDSTPKEYKPYLESYFANLNVKKNNFFTDISNYISYEMGQPTHCYDLEKLKNKKIILHKLKQDKFFKTLQGKEIMLKSGDLVFQQDSEVINLAGIMGGSSSSCSPDTTKVLVEAAHFLPDSIIGKTIKYNINSDAAYKFERWVDPNMQEEAIRRFIKIVSDHANIISMRMSCSDKNDSDKKIIPFSNDNIERILGVKVDEDLSKGFLSSLGFEFQSKKTVQVPSYRNDIKDSNDLSEEIARMIGYDNIERNTFKIANKIEFSNKEDIKLKRYLVNKGFSEIINIPFVSKSSISTIVLDNPLDTNKDSLRTNIIDSLLQNLLYNERRQKDSIKLFEIADVYELKDKKVSYKRKLGLIATGRVDKNFRDFTRKIDSDFISDLFKDLGFEIQDIIKIDRNGLNTKIKTPIFATEIEFDHISEIIDDIKFEEDNPLFTKDIKYKKISDFPSVFRDLSFSLDDNDTLKKLIKILDKLSPNYLIDSFIFDFYEDSKTNQTKVGFRFIFQSDKATLTDEDVEKSMADIVESTIGIKGVKIPGLKK